MATAFIVVHPHMCPMVQQIAPTLRPRLGAYLQATSLVARSSHLPVSSRSTQSLAPPLFVRVWSAVSVMIFARPANSGRGYRNFISVTPRTVTKHTGNTGMIPSGALQVARQVEMPPDAQLSDEVRDLMGQV